MRRSRKPWEERSRLENFQTMTTSVYLSPLVIGSTTGWRRHWRYTRKDKRRYFHRKYGETPIHFIWSSPAGRTHFHAYRKDTVRSLRSRRMDEAQTQVYQADRAARSKNSFNSGIATSRLYFSSISRLAACPRGR